MKTMVTRFADVRAWWHQREPRERTLLAVMGVAIAAFIAWYGVWAPLQRLRDAAQTRNAAAAAELEQVRGELAALAALQGRMPARPGDAAALKKVVIESAGKAGLAISRERPNGTGGVDVECDAVTTQALFAWLDALRVNHALAPTSLSVAKSEDRLRVQASFQRGSGAR